MEGSTCSINLSCGNIIVISHQTFQRGIWIWISQEPQRTMLMLKLLDTYMMSASSSDGKWEIILSKHEWQLVERERERERERGEQIRISRAGGLDQLSWGERCANISSDGLHSSGERGSDWGCTVHHPPLSSLLSVQWTLPPSSWGQDLTVWQEREVKR